jgi:hypothetical protein
MSPGPSSGRMDSFIKVAITFFHFAFLFLCLYFYFSFYLELLCPPFRSENDSVLNTIRQILAPDRSARFGRVLACAAVRHCRRQYPILMVSGCCCCLGAAVGPQWLVLVDDHQQEPHMTE